MYGSPQNNIRQQTFGSLLGPSLSSIGGTPSHLQSLIIDFDSRVGLITSNGKVISWQDKIKGIVCKAPSIAARPTQVLNTFDGIPGVSCNGSTTFLTFLGRIAELEGRIGLTMVMMSAGAQPGSYSVTDRGGAIYQVQDSTTKQMEISCDEATVSSLNFKGTVRDGVATVTTVQNDELGGQLKIYAVSYNGNLADADKIQLSINGGARLTGTTNAGPKRTFVSKANEVCEFNIGARSIGAGLSGASRGGTFVRIQFYNETIPVDSDKMRNIINGLKNEYRTIYKRQVICIGDSRTADSKHPTTPGWTEQLQTLLGQSAWLVENAGIDGETVALMLTRETNKILSTINTYNRQIFVVWAGLNDFFLNGDLAAAIYANLKTYCQNIKTAAPNSPIVLCTELPSTGAGWNVQRAALNVLINTEVSPSWDYICDLGANATMGPDAAASDTSLYSDGTHPTQTGDGYIATDVFNIIKTL